MLNEKIKDFKQQGKQKGNPKTLTPGPRTPTTDRVRGLPMDRSTDYPYGPLLRTIYQNRKNIRNKYFSYGLPNRSCRRNFERYILIINVTFLGSGSGASYIITHCHFLCCGHTVYEIPWKPPGILRKSLEICALSPPPFCSPILTWIRELVPDFIICSPQSQIQTSLKWTT